MTKPDRWIHKWRDTTDSEPLAKHNWAIKQIEAAVQSQLSSNSFDIPVDQIQTGLNHYTALHLLYSQKPFERLADVHLIDDKEILINHWLEHSRTRQSTYNVDEKVRLIFCIISYLEQLLCLSLPKTYEPSTLSTEPNVSPLSFKQLSDWFISFIDLIRHQESGPNWARLFFQQLSPKAYHDLEAILVHPDTAHLMFHIYYYKLYPDQLSPAPLHPERLISVGKRLAYLYAHIEQFVDAFIQFSHHQYQKTHQDFLCHGHQLPEGIQLNSQENFRTLIIDSLKQLKTKPIVNQETPTEEIIDAFYRAYQFWFNPTRILDAILSLCNRLGFSIAMDNIEQQKKIVQHMHKAYQTLNTEACINLYGHFSNNDTRYLLRILHYLSLGHQLSPIPKLTDKQRALIQCAYHGFLQIISALSETLNDRNIPCLAVSIYESNSPPNPGRRNSDAIIHVITTYGDNHAPQTDHLEDLFNALEDS